MRSILSCSVAALALWVPVEAQATDSAERLASSELSELSIEQLAQIPVRSASKREEPLSSAPAALYVITGEDIVANGLTTLPEALRLAPNLNVQQIDASQYSISTRGFNGLQAGNKVLALIDGRSIYTPLASSVFWNLHFPIVEDVRQIEVVSGPGGTLYGPNAVNGVISITSRDAQDTLGSLVRVTAGPEEQSVGLRHGFTIGTAGAARLYAGWHNADDQPQGLGANANDAYRGWQAGFRSDFVSETDHFTLQADLFRTDSETLSGDGAKGHNVLARWSRTLSDQASFRIQAYYDQFERAFTLVDDSLSTIDAEGQINLTAGRHNIVAGAGIRRTRDKFVNELNFFQLNPARRTLWVYNAFIQDNFRLTDALGLTAGVKVERSTFSGWQVLPNLRLAWQPNDRHMLWAAISRAVRTPSRIDRQLEAPPFLLQAEDFGSEKLIAVEAGYRGQPTSIASLSINGFVNFYDDLRTTEFTGQAFQLNNGGKGTTFGIGAWGAIQLTPSWRAWIGATTLWKQLDDKAGHLDLAPRNSRGNDPNWQIVGRTQIDLSDRLQLTLNGRVVGDIDMNPEIGSYVEAGGQIAYRVTDDIELFAAGRNLLHRTHLESNDPGASQLARRSVYLGARGRF